MIPLPRLQLRALPVSQWRWPEPDELLQEALGGDPWKVAIASMLLCRTTRRQAEAALLRILRRWPSPEYLCRADESELQNVVRPCGLYRNRATQLVRFSSQWLGEGWGDLRELSGVGPYVADAVGLVCFGCTELESSDGALARRAAEQAAARLAADEGGQADSALLGGAVP